MIDLSHYKDRLSDSGYRVLAQAIEESQRRHHFYLGVEHIFLAFSKVEMAFFEQILGELRLDSKKVLHALNEYLNVCKQYLGGGMKVPPPTKSTFKAAWDEAQRRGRTYIDGIDLFLAIFQDTEGIPAKIMEGFGVRSESVAQEVIRLARRRDQKAEELERRYDLPSTLKQFGVNVNKLVYEGKVPPIIGREREIREVIEILCHRERTNSAMVIGEPGVGKSALVEGLARWIELEPYKVPKRLRDMQVVNLQMNTIVAGTVFRGMFEDRMEKIINEVKERKNIVLFVDEAHLLIGAGSAMGVPADAANILKSALSKGEVQIIGATTSSEYRQFIQEDEALARRFKPVYIEEPTKEEAREIVYGIKPRLEYNYGVEISDEAIDVLLNMSDRYLRNTKLPDKVIGWLHTSCVKVELDKPDEPVVKPENVLEVVAQESKLPIDMVYRDTLDRFKELEAHLSGRVVGQREAIAAVTRHLRVNKGPLKENFSRPDAVMLFLGPTGVGKTELAKVLAEFLFGDENRMVRVDMSEFRDGAISVDKLIGMPRGIVGSERGGILTNRVKDNPYSLVLLDEMEKASQEVLNLFLQVFDEGWLTDGRGRRVYFSDTVIVMTSNIGADRFKKLLKPMGFMGEQGQLADAKKAVMRDVEDAFSPEFLNRMDDIVVFNPLTPDEIRSITRMYLDSIAGQMASMHKKLLVSEEAIDMLSKEGYSIKYGARFLKRSIDEKVKMPITLSWKASSEFFVVVQDGRVAVRWD